MNALTNLDDTELSALAGALAEQRDRAVANGDHRLAAVWAEWSADAATVRDANRATLRRAEEAVLDTLIQPLFIEPAGGGITIFSDLEDDPRDVWWNE